MKILRSSLNPYCSGRWSRTCQIDKLNPNWEKSLNPYCSGRWSRTLFIIVIRLILMGVLILIVVEDGLVLP